MPVMGLGETMRNPIILAALFSVVLARPAVAAPALEAVTVNAAASFAAFAPGPAGGIGTAELNISGMPLQRPPFTTTSATSDEAVTAPQFAPTAEADLKALLNAHLKSQLSVNLGGKKAFIGGVFDRQQNAFLSVWIEGDAAPLIFNIKGLLDKAGTIQSGSAAYTLYLEANPLSPLKSKIAFENKANENDLQTVRLGVLLNAIEASGQLVQLTGQAYRLFYYQDVQESAGGAVLNPNSRTMALILKEGEELHVFLIPEETVPSDKLAVFKVFKDKKIGLQRIDGKLRIYEL